MKAYKCDICGKYYDKPDEDDKDRTIDGFRNAYSLCFINGLNSYTSRQYDFCKECGIKLRNFITGGREENE